jgi:hypothetical protein
LLVFCILCVLQEVGTIPLTRYLVGASGAYAIGRNTPFAWRLTVFPESAAAKAGLQTGDVVDARVLTPEQRFRLWSQAPVADRPESFPVVRGANIDRITVIPPAYPFTWALWVAIAAGFWSALCAIVLLIRRGEDRGVQVLVLYLLLVRLSIQMSPDNWVTPYPVADLVNALLNAMMPVGWALLATYAVHFVASNRATRALAGLSYLLAVYIAATGALAALGSWFGFVDPLNPWLAGVPDAIMQGAYFLAPLLCAIIALRAARGMDRARMAWLLGPTAVIYLIQLSYLAANFVPALNSEAAGTISLLLQLLAPLGITYAMLNRRLLDIGFVVNRAVVYAGVSVVVFGIFALVEWAFGEWFSTATHSQNLLMSAALALGLGFSIRPIHQRVDSVLDRVFFQKRHEDESAIRRFAHEAPYITDGETLMERAREVLVRHADASFVTFALDDGAGQYGEVSENDPALVTLRSSRSALDLTASATNLPGEFAYPMIARGRMLGALAIGPKRSGESYAPDESQAIAALAHGVATALDVLALSDGRRDDVLLDAILDVRRAIATLSDRIEPRGA